MSDFWGLDRDAPWLVAQLQKRFRAAKITTVDDGGAIWIEVRHNDLLVVIEHRPAEKQFGISTPFEPLPRPAPWGLFGEDQGEELIEKLVEMISSGEQLRS